ncbi:MAG: carboxypeptidase-like regulatory domain-containing protein [Ilumatobacter sp.]
MNPPDHHGTNDGMAEAVPPDREADDRMSTQEGDAMLALLGEALATSDPVPDHVVDAAKGAFTWRTIDAELAELVFDSANDLAGVRSEDMDRQMTFQAPGVEIEVMVTDESSRRLIGQLIPPAEMRIDVIAGDDITSVESDRLGRFSFDDLAPGPVRLVVLGANGETLVQTEWVIF